MAVNRTGSASPQPTVIFGTGGQGREMHTLIEANNDQHPTWDMLGWLDDKVDQHGREVHGLPVLGGIGWLQARPEVGVLIGVGATATRRKIAERLRAAGHTRFPSIVHPSAVMGRRVEHGEGLVVCAGSVLTTNITLGSFCLLNAQVFVGHDARLADYVTVAPGSNITGNVTLSEGVDFGAGASMVQGRTVGEWSIVGAGAVVARDLPANVTAVGVPARVIKERPPGWHLG